MGSRRTMYVSEVAEQLGISKRAAYRALRQGAIPSIRIGRLYLVPGDAVDRLLAKANQKAPFDPEEC